MKRKRWTGKLVGGLLGLTALGGCKQQIFLEPADFQDAVKADKLAKYQSPVALCMMRAIKQALDPQGIMNPGRVLQ